MKLNRFGKAAIGAGLAASLMFGGATYAFAEITTTDKTVVTTPGYSGTLLDDTDTDCTNRKTELYMSLSSDKIKVKIPTAVFLSVKPNGEFVDYDFTMTNASTCKVYLSGLLVTMTNGFNLASSSTTTTKSSLQNLVNLSFKIGNTTLDAANYLYDSKSPKTVKESFVEKDSYNLTDLCMGTATDSNNALKVGLSGKISNFANTNLHYNRNFANVQWLITAGDIYDTSWEPDNSASKNEEEKKDNQENQGTQVVQGNQDNQS